MVTGVVVVVVVVVVSVVVVSLASTVDVAEIPVLVVVKYNVLLLR